MKLSAVKALHQLPPCASEDELELHLARCSNPRDMTTKFFCAINPPVAKEKSMPTQTAENRRLMASIVEAARRENPRSVAMIQRLANTAAGGKDPVSIAMQACQSEGWSGTLTEFVEALDQAAQDRGVSTTDLARILAGDPDQAAAFAGAGGPVPKYGPNGSQQSLRNSRQNGVALAYEAMTGKSYASVDQRPLGERWALDIHQRKLAHAAKFGLPAPDAPASLQASSIRDVTDAPRPRQLASAMDTLYGRDAPRRDYSTGTSSQSGGTRTTPVHDTSGGAPNLLPTQDVPTSLLSDAWDVARRGGYVGGSNQLEGDLARYGATMGWDAAKAARFIVGGGSLAVGLFLQSVNGASVASVAGSSMTPADWLSAGASNARRMAKLAGPR